MGILYTGADDIVLCQLYDRNGAKWQVPLVADVKAALIDVKTGVLISVQKTIISTDDENDWGNGLVAVPFSASETADYEPGTYGLEIRIYASKVYMARASYVIDVVESVIA